MAFCGKCGTQVGEGEKFCPNCGAPIEAAPAAENIIDKAQNVLNTEDTTSEYDPADVQPNRGLAWLSYCGPLVFIPMFVRKDSKYTQFHVRQGFTLFAIYVAYGILAALLGLIKVESTRTLWGIPYTVKVTPWPITVILAIGWILIAVLSVIGIINAASGKAKKLPLIGNIDVLGWFVKK
ncbi:MAG: zinc ribbon domain-containing protein [Clostridia bacterium]|nr:zinc ribbon domain-containing protein [Clostridia bacterium]